MDIQTVTALIDTQGPDISGRVVDMPAGSTHYVSGKDARDFYANHPDTFTLGAAYDTVLERHAAEHADLPAAAEEFTDGSAAAPSIAFAADPDTGLYRIGANNLGVAAGGAKVLDIGTTGLGVTGALSSSKTLTLPAGNIAANGGIKFGANASLYSDAASLVRVRDSADTGYADVMVGWLTTSGNCAVGGALNLAGASSGQIIFPATQNASSNANTLDDYEEGTWTPVVRGDGTAGTYELTQAFGHYTKIGREVTVYCYAALAGAITGGGTGNLAITGLPFSKTADQNFCGPVSVEGVDYTAGANLTTSAASAGGTSANVYIKESNDNAPWTYIPISALAANDIINFTLHYHV